VGLPGELWIKTTFWAEVMAKVPCIYDPNGTNKIVCANSRVLKQKAGDKVYNDFCESLCQKVLNTFKTTMVDVYHVALDLEIIHKDTLLKERALWLLLTTLSWMTKKSSLR
jgi:hypothetical protein